MAKHETVTGLVQEAISEYLFTAEWCVKYVKSASWGPGQAGGCLGFPGAALMFCITDTIGSYHRGNEQHRIQLEKRNLGDSAPVQMSYLLTGVSAASHTIDVRWRALSGTMAQNASTWGAGRSLRN